MKASIPLVVVSLLLSMATGLLLARRDHAPSVARGRRPPLIGLSMDTLKEARWQKDRDIFVARAEALGARVEVQSANSDDVRQVMDVKSLLANDVDVLVIIAHDGAAMGEGVRLAREAGVPVIAYDRLITDCDLDMYLSFDNVKVGELQAQYLVDHLPGHRGRIVRVYGSPTDQNARLFKQGQDRVLLPLIQKGEIQVLHEDWATDWDPAAAKRIVNAALTRCGGRLDGVLASNDATAGGAVQSLMEAGLSGRVLVTGQDADLVACQRIARGTQAMTVYKPIRDIAEKAAELAVRMCRGGCVAVPSSLSNGRKEVPSLFLPVRVVDQENLRQTVVADGFHKESEVYGERRP